MSEEPSPEGSRESDPLEYHTIADTVVSALLKKPMETLQVEEPFPGAGVYALYYIGKFEPYLPICGSETPIYVGKAIPPGSRRGMRQIEHSQPPALFSRLRDHAASIDAAKNLNLSDFRCRYLVVTPIWITIAESLLIARFHPVWNSVVDGFGLHHPGKTRFTQKRSDWDTLHPGRAWAPMMSEGKDVATILAAIREHFSM